MLFNPQMTTIYSQHTLSALAQLRLKIQGNIEEQPMDVKGLVGLHLGEIIKFSRQDAKAQRKMEKP